MRTRPSVRSTLSPLLLLGLGLAAASGGSCSASQRSASGPEGSMLEHGPDEGKCEATAASTLKPLQNQGQGSAVALGVFSDGPMAKKTLAFVADTDAKSVTVVDVDSRKEIASHKVLGSPSQVMILTDGRVAVALRDTSKIEVLHPRSDGTFTDGCAVDTDAEPIALAETPDHKTLLVTSGWGHSLVSFESDSLAKKGRVDLPREPRAVVVDDEGKLAYVAHAVGGQVSTVDLETMHASNTRILVNPQMAFQGRNQPFTLTSAINSAVGDGSAAEKPGRQGTRVGCQGFPITKAIVPKGRILAPQVLVDPGDPDARASGYGDGNTPTEVTNVAVFDAGSQKLLTASVSDLTPREQFFGGEQAEPARGECILPRAAAYDPGSQSLLVTCLGIDSLIAYDAASANPASVEKVRWDVGSGPVGVAVDTEHSRAVVWSQFERSLDVVDLSKTDRLTDADSHSKPDRIALKSMSDPMSLSVVLGRQLFHAVGDTRISKDGRACASCHPDGRDDSITWATPDGPRRSVMLAGRLEGTEPFAWGGTSKDLRDHLHHTFERLSGQGLRNVELEALVAYVESLPTPPREVSAHADLVAKGQEIFNSKNAECSSCHANGGMDTKNHNIQSRDHADTKSEFNTPSLKFVTGHAPYFHDGRYETLHDLLIKSDGTMGHTKQLVPGDVDALEAYLRTL